MVTGQPGALGVPVLPLAMEGPKHEIVAAPILRRLMVVGSALDLPMRLILVVQCLALVSILKTVTTIESCGSNFLETFYFITCHTEVSHKLTIPVFFFFFFLENRVNN